MKTYARSVRRVWDGEDAPIAKKIFIERPKVVEDAGENLERAIRETSIAASSSPSRKNSTIFSAASQDDETVTPPSSPPPRITPPPVYTRKPTFPFLKRKQDASREGTEPLSEVVNSSDVRSSVPPSKKPKLVQTQLDLGVETRKTCSDCGMEYIPSNTEDATLHRMYHDMDKDGVDLGKAFMKSSAMKWAYEVAHIEGLVVVVDRKVSPAARLQVKKVLEVVTKELSAPDIEDSVLWSQKSLNTLAENNKAIKQHVSEERNDHKSDRYKVFLHLKDGKCVGLCLAERITEGYKVKANKLDKGDSNETAMRPISSSISVEEQSSPAVVGISRIWTSKAFRRKGIATNLLDCVMNHFIYGMEIEKEEVAFSQPTESGGKLAREWFGADSGWLVYNEQ
ncbi:putative sister chromatid cohesion acetyltransferase eco1 [Phaeomoniella chlamydospora]|uniref:Putative sister chromatid cohesion acetyltransferase eco1 n=1 Tax=Phaeomoniella chlamydospora TaxID=158046 RepID=A0A0G2EQJ6_PHACM|nr:putative sister chromatid cohesion acetyltransferase eco1 [Phaeomoniella chlamydospora]